MYQKLAGPQAPSDFILILCKLITLPPGPTKIGKHSVTDTHLTKHHPAACPRR